MRFSTIPFVCTSLAWSVAGLSGRIVQRGIDCTYSILPSPGDTCNTLATTWALTEDQFKTLNPGVNCINLDLDREYCVIGSVTTGSPTTTTKPPSTTKPSDPEQTCWKNVPGPIASIQPGTVCGCDKWHLVKDGQTCDAIIGEEHVNTSDFFKWNPKVGGNACNGLWKGYYVCIHGPNPSKPPTTTKPPSSCYTNAPDPVQPGAVCNCDKWHRLASSSGTCNDIIKYENIYADDFYKWNPKIGGPACTGLWQGYFTCVHVPGARVPPPPCHPNAPSPVQPGAACNCKKWHYVKKVGATCEEVINYEHIKADDFYRWNPKIGGKACTGVAGL